MQSNTSLGFVSSLATATSLTLSDDQADATRCPWPVVVEQVIGDTTFTVKQDSAQGGHYQPVIQAHFADVAGLE